MAQFDGIVNSSHDKIMTEDGLAEFMRSAVNKLAVQRLVIPVAGMHLIGLNTALEEGISIAWDAGVRSEKRKHLAGLAG